MENMNILFVGPKFNSYEKTITKTLKKSEKYNKVLFVQDCPLRSTHLFALLYNLFPSIKLALVKYFNKKIIKIIKKNNIDCFFILKGEFVLSETITAIRKSCPKIKIIVYQWDSINNNPQAKDLLQLADDSYTFDPIDAQNLNITYLPLFSSWKETGLNQTEFEKQIKFDILSIGGYRGHRIPYVNAMKEFCEQNELTYRFHNYENFMSFLKNRKKLNIKLADVSFSRISYKKYYTLLLQSKAVLDIHSPSQNGLTMRTMETLSLNKKLITTNKNIFKEPFYNKNNIYVIQNPEDLKSRQILDFINYRFNNSEGVLTLTEWLIRMCLL